LRRRSPTRYGFFIDRHSDFFVNTNYLIFGKGEEFRKKESGFSNQELGSSNQAEPCKAWLAAWRQQRQASNQYSGFSKVIRRNHTKLVENPA
jgi:hypothetical protein